VKGKPVNPPERLAPTHGASGFDCGEPTLNEWLVRRALRNELSGARRTYVVCKENRVVGHSCLPNGAIDQDDAPKPLQRNVPSPIPAKILGRLAVDRRLQGQRLGQALLRDAILRTLQASDIAGIKALLVHAISGDAKRFYLHHGFVESPLASMTLCLALDSVRQAPVASNE
jgi:GNAT superfamily N-acetyltransferase